MRFFGVCLSVFLLLSGVTSAQAACSDAPGPGVDYRRCYLDHEPFNSLDLSNARLREASLIRSDLSLSKLDDIDGRRLKAIRSNAKGASFTTSNLSEADFTKADLQEANFTDANLTRARFFEADLRKANFTGANLESTDFQKANLSGATWVDGSKICVEGSIGVCR